MKEQDKTYHTGCIEMALEATQKHYGDSFAITYSMATPTCTSNIRLFNFEFYVEYHPDEECYELHWWDLSKRQGDIEWESSAWPESNLELLDRLNGLFYLARQKYEYNQKTYQYRER